MDRATTQIYTDGHTLSLPAALPIYIEAFVGRGAGARGRGGAVGRIVRGVLGQRVDIGRTVAAAAVQRGQVETGARRRVDAQLLAQCGGWRQVEDRQDRDVLLRLVVRVAVSAVSVQLAAVGKRLAPRVGVVVPRFERLV